MVKTTSSQKDKFQHAGVLASQSPINVERALNETLAEGTYCDPWRFYFYDVLTIRRTVNNPRGIVTLLNNMRTNLMGRQPSGDSDSFMPRLHGRGSEGAMRLG
jgi:hypothetical protein